jgi:hypothetical protein
VKRGATVTYRCCLCPDGSKLTQAPEASALALLQLCQAHHDKRFADGMAAQRKADREAAARG